MSAAFLRSRTPHGEGTPCVVLNVDDEEIARYAKSRVLRHAGYEVVEATTGHDALEAVRLHRPSVVLLDVNLPDLSGTEVCRRIKADTALADTLVLQTSATFTSTSDRVRGLVCGADGYLPQPAEPEELLANVEALLRIRRAEEARQRSESALALALEATSTGIWTWDVNTDEVAWSPETYAIHGLPQDRFDGTCAAFFALVHPEDRARVRDLVETAIAERRSYESEFRIVRPGGEVVWVANRGRASYDAAGRPLVVLGTITDITEKRRAEDAVRASEALLQALLEGSPTPIYAKDLDGRHFLVNRAWCDFAGIDRDDAIGATDEQLFGPEIAAVLGATDRRAREADGPVIVEESITWRGRESTFLSSKFPLRDATGRVHAVCGVSIDITERKRAEQLLQEADRRKDVFLATLSHELRNPLAPIRTATQILGSPKLKPEQLQWAQSVLQRQVRHMAWLLDDLLDLARITQGKLAIAKERIALAAVLESAVEAARPLLDGKGHRLTVTLPDEAPVLDADPLRLSQVVSNLLTNAAKYTDPGGRIELTATVEPAAVVITVQDDGIGIPADALERIFTMFSQVEATSRRTDGGLGIGLALVKGLVELHGGTVRARSDGERRGSAFTVRLPLACSDAGGESGESQERGAAAAECRRVLVVDDNADAANSLALVLRLAGHEVQVAHDGRAALEAARGFRPDVVLLDIGLPQMNGYEVAQALRAEPWGPQLHLVALSGWGQRADKHRASSEGFDEHLTKPVDVDVLEKLIRSGRSAAVE